MVLPLYPTAPAKAPVVPTACEKLLLYTTAPLKVDNPETVKVAVETDTKDPPPLVNVIVGVVVEGKLIVSNLPTLAITWPEAAPLKSNTPVEVLIPKTFSYPFIQFWRIRKLELI